MKPFKVGIIGCGNIGARYDENGDGDNIYTHAGLFSRNSGFELVGAAESDAQRREAFGRYWAVDRLYADHRELIRREALDVISVATPDHTHCDIISDILEIRAPKLIFTEKPVAESVSEAERIRTLAEKHHTTIVVDYVRRWDLNHQKIKQMLIEHQLGPIQSIIGYYVRGIRHNGCQMINLLQYWFGPIRQVRVLGEGGKGSLEGDPSLTVECGFENHMTAQMVGLDRDGYGFSIFEIDIFGRDGRLRILNGGQQFAYYRVSGDPQFVNFKQLKKSPSVLEQRTYGQALQRAGAYLLSILKGEKVDLINPLPEAVYDLQVIETIMNACQHTHFELINH